MGKINATIVGNLTADPELKTYGQGGEGKLASFTLASTPSRFDKATKSWTDGETVFVRVTVFGKKAESAVSGLHKGDQVFASGSLVQRTYKNKSGAEVKSLELTADELGLSVTSLQKSKTGLTGTTWGSIDDEPF